MIAFKNIGKENTEKSLGSFRLLAESGNVPMGVEKGHYDGWGIGLFRGGDIFLGKECTSALEGDKYGTMVDLCTRDHYEVIVGHLRKSSVGNVSYENTHPFLIDGLMFCQNGTIFGSDKIELEDEFEKRVAGDTDSERFFAYLIQVIRRNEDKHDFVEASISESVNHIKANFDYTAINFVLTDGKNIWALREVNEDNSLVQEKGMLDYYTLYVGRNKNGDALIISSEKLLLDDMSWEEISNHKLVVI